MNDLDQFREKLLRSFEGHLDRPEVRVIPAELSRQVLGIVVSPTFEGMDDYDRQRIVWDRVLKTFDEMGQDRIGFIFTNAPSEVESDTQEPDATSSDLTSDHST